MTAGLAVTIGGGSADDWAAVIVSSTSKPSRACGRHGRDRVRGRQRGASASVGDDGRHLVGSDDSPANVFTGQVLSIRRDVRGAHAIVAGNGGARNSPAHRLNRPTTGSRRVT